MKNYDDKLKELEEKIIFLEQQNKKMAESQVKLGEVTNNYLMLHYLNKNIHECNTSQKLWETYLHNITDYGLNYDNVYIFISNDTFDSGGSFVKLSLKDGALHIDNLSLPEVPNFVISSFKSKSSVTYNENTQAAIPIINNFNDVRGIVVASKEFGITFEEIELLEIYAQQTVSTIENITLNEKLLFNQELLGKKIDQFVMLHYVSKEIHDSIRYHEVLEKYLSALTSELGFNFGIAKIFLPDENLPDKFRTVSLENGSLSFGNPCRLDITANRAYNDMRYHLSDDGKYLAIPLINSGNVSAIMVVCDENGINTEDIQLLDIFAMQTSTMLENTKLNFNLRKEVDKRTAELNNAFNELKKLDRLKDEFLAMVSHELRTPLTSILAYMETIIADLSEHYMDEDTKGEFLHIIQDEAKRLKLIVDDVLELSKLEAGKMTYNNTETDLNAILEDLCAEYLPLIEAGEILLKKSFETIPTVKCDTEKITKVISNIMSNAVKFTGTKGTITVGSYTSENNVIIFIRDTGIGISEDNFKKIFSRFEQIEDISHHSKGTGLGLPIAKLIIEQQNGKIWFESKEGAGSTFYIMLPSL